MKYQSKSAQVDAVQWTGENFDDVQLISPDAAINFCQCRDILTIRTVRGYSDVYPGEWVVRQDEQVYKLHDVEFEDTFEPALSPPSQASSEPVAAQSAPPQAEFIPPIGPDPEAEANKPKHPYPAMSQEPQKEPESYLPNLATNPARYEDAPPPPAPFPEQSKASVPLSPPANPEKAAEPESQPAVPPEVNPAA